MRRTATITLWRAWPVPRARRVEVVSFSVGRFLAVLEKGHQHAVMLRVKKAQWQKKQIELLANAPAPMRWWEDPNFKFGQITEQDIIRGLSEDDFCTLADLACPGERPGFFRRYFTARNVLKLLGALGDATAQGVHDWKTLLSVVNLGTGKSPKKERRVGSVQGDIARFCSYYPNTNPFSVLEQDMAEFIFACRGIADANAEPEEDQTPIPFEALKGFGGLGVETVH